jgi:hypothetical protein
LAGEVPGTTNYDPVLAAQSKQLEEGTAVSSDSIETPEDKITPKSG